MEVENIEETLTKISLKIAKQHKGCIFVIMNNKFDYSSLIEQDIQPFKVYDHQRRVEALASLDGACIINPDGFLISYSAHILNAKSFVGFGTRHSAAYTASFNGNIVIMASEEDSKVRIFKDGKLIMQLDAFEKGIENKTKEVTSIMESIGAGTLSAIGVGILVPTVGLTLIPGIIIFSTSHYVFKMVEQLLNGNGKK
jgi:DNA integrity scanning protein DisA with diadenylate cyclase activity